MAFIRTKASIAALALAFSCAALPGVAQAEDVSFPAADGSREFPLSIDAAVSEPKPIVIKVEVPSSSSAVAINIETSVIDGRFLGFQAGECRIKNLAESTVPVSASVFEVEDGVNGTAKALGFLDVSLTADHTVHLVEGPHQSGLIVESLAPGREASIVLNVAETVPGTLIPEGSYAASATIKVAAA